MLKPANQNQPAHAAVRNIPCTGGGSLLELFLRVADGVTDLDPVSLPSLIQASPFFDTARTVARAFLRKWNQLVGVRAVVTPTEATILDQMVRPSDSQQTNLPRRFLRENAGANIPKPFLKLKGRESRQTHE
jgi:hypothetical protein